MKKAGYIILFVSIAIFAVSVTLFTLFISSFLNIQNQRSAAEEFLISEPRHHYVNTALDDLLSEKVVIETPSDYSMSSSEYMSPEGILFISKSEEWDSSDLELLYKELLQNKHGEELYSLGAVTIFPQKDDMAAATHRNSEYRCAVPFSHTVLPVSFQIYFTRSTGQISLYNGDQITTAEGMANSLSHEYGHHFTRYYMLKSSGEALYDTKYARLRGLNEKNSYADMNVSEDFYYENHYKFILEIAAEDYVALMGSPASREIVDYKDAMETLYMDEYNAEFSLSAAVQENLTLPMACEIEGLADYFYGFLDEKAPEYDIKKEMNIRIKKLSQSYNLVGGYRSFVYYEVGFDKVYGEDATYVLTVYDPEDYFNTLHPVRTFTNGEKPLCHIGNPVRNLGSRVIYSDDKVAKGTKVFIVNVITLDGQLYTSAPFTYTF